VNKKLKLYKKYSDKYIKEFGLTDWECHYFLSSDMDSVARTRADMTGKVVSFFVSTKYLKTMSVAETDRTAFHEVCELMLWEYYELCEDFLSSKLLQRVAHNTIRRMENREFGLDYGVQVK